MVGDVLVDSEASVVILLILRSRDRVAHACFHNGECACIQAYVIVLCFAKDN